jgi:uncharacterized protein (UPF0335 family)
MAQKKDDNKTSTVRGAGDNAPETEVSGDRLMGFINKLEKLDKKKDQVLQESREVYADAKAIGYDNKTIRAIIKERKMEPEKRKEMADLLVLYKSAIGMLDDDDE